jgi:hypothetical protein
MKARIALLLLIWLMGATVSAQPGQPGPGTVDSREECAAAGGAWQARNRWQSACEMPWSRDDCLRLGGAWTEVAKASTGGRCLARVSEFAMATQCLDGGGRWGPPGSRAPQCTFEPPRAAAPVARKPASDAGKRCDSQADCTYGCVYEGPPVAAGADVLGRCRASSIAGGCFSMVESGRLAGSVCVK